MAKFKFVEEYEINTSSRIIYPYLHDSAKLSEWLADQVKMDGNKILVFNWAYENQHAKMTAARLNKQIKFEFLDENKEKIANASYIDFRLQESELTSTTFLKVTDYSDMDDEEELRELWEGLIANLKEVLGV